jgi:hypothetical protein
MHQGDDRTHYGNGGRGAPPAGVGHNAHRLRAAQWQTPHRDDGHDQPQQAPERDLDKVEIAFIAGFMDAPDPTSFLRLAHVPFEVAAGDGATLRLLRVEIDAMTDVGSLTPHLGGASFRYDPLPASLVSSRRRLRFVYFDGTGPRTLSFAEVRAG